MYGYAMRCDDSYKPTVAEQAIAIPDVSGALTTTIGSVNSLKPVYSPQVMNHTLSKRTKSIISSHVCRATCLPLWRVGLPPS